MENLEMLKKTLCKELDEIAERVGQKKTLAGTELEQVSKLMMTLKNLYKIEMLEEESSHAMAMRGDSMGRGVWNARGGYSNMENESYRRGRGRSYDGGGESYDGSYAYDGDSYAERRGRDARGRYTSRSMHDSKYEMVEGIREMMDKEGLSPQSREILHKAMEQLSK